MKRNPFLLFPTQFIQFIPVITCFSPLFVFFLRICILCAYTQQVFLGCSPMSNFIYSRNRQTERDLHWDQAQASFLGRSLAWLHHSEAWASAAFVYIWGTNIFFSSWIPVFQCTLINCKSKWSQRKMIIKIKLKPMYILSIWHAEHPLVVQRVPNTTPIYSIESPCFL